jgi:hypothetical protein
VINMSRDFSTLHLGLNITCWQQRYLPHFEDYCSPERCAERASGH